MLKWLVLVLVLVLPAQVWGTGPTDYETEIGLFLPLAERGNMHAQYELGMLYGDADNPKRNSPAAARWIERAANQGHPDAQFALGLMHMFGRHVLQDYVTAHMWFNLSATAPAYERLGAKNRDELATKMTPGQVTDAQQLARSWRPKKEVE